MPSFRYVAITPSGEMTRGAMQAASPQAVVEALRRQGNIPVRADPESGGFSLAGILTASLGGGAKLRRQEVADLTRELAIMLTAGQDLDRALRFLVETAPNPRVAAILDQIRAGVRDGASLATVLARFPTSFPRLYVGLIRAGEAGGVLAPTLERLAMLLERERSLSATVNSAMIYPAILMAGAIGAIVLLLTQVLPQFVPLFEQNGAQLPTPTRILIDVGNAVSAYGLYALVGLGLLGLAVRQALTQPAVRLRFDRLVLWLPVLGGLSREVLAARFSRTLGTLVINGTPLIAALDIVREVIGNLAAVGAVQAATESAKGGAGLSRPLAESGIFPLRTIYLLRLGEETAQLGPMALRAAEIHEENVRLGVQRLISLLVPAITIVMGAAVAGIVASLMLAMLSLNDLAGS
jgi:general secretion pathway protein F